MYKEMIRVRIKEKFKTIENFSKHMGIPRTTINFILKNGVASSNFSMVNKILKELDIYSVNECPVILDDKLLDFLMMYNSLDDFGKHTVLSVAETEYRRICPDSYKDAYIAAYGGISASKPLTDEEKSILDLVERIKNEENND